MGLYDDMYRMLGSQMGGGMGMAPANPTAYTSPVQQMPQAPGAPPPYGPQTINPLADQSRPPAGGSPAAAMPPLSLPTPTDPFNQQMRAMTEMLSPQGVQRATWDPASAIRQLQLADQTYGPGGRGAAPLGDVLGGLNKTLESYIRGAGVSNERERGLADLAQRGAVEKSRLGLEARKQSLSEGLARDQLDTGKQAQKTFLDMIGRGADADTLEAARQSYDKYVRGQGADAQHLPGVPGLGGEDLMSPGSLGGPPGSGGALPPRTVPPGASLGSQIPTDVKKIVDKVAADKNGQLSDAIHQVSVLYPQFYQQNLPGLLQYAGSKRTGGHEEINTWANRIGLGGQTGERLRGLLGQHSPDDYLAADVRARLGIGQPQTLAERFGNMVGRGINSASKGLRNLTGLDF